MTVDLREVQAHAFADAAAWWQNRPFPYRPDGTPYRCTACGRPIMHREGTSLIGAEMRCAPCTAQYFAAQAPAPPPAYVPSPPPPVASPPPPVAAPPPPVAAAPVASPPTPVPPQPTLVLPPTAVGPPPAPPMAAGYPAPPGYPPPAQLAPRHPHRRRNLLIVAAVIAAVAGLVVGLFVWAPWNKPAPAVPQQVVTSSSSSRAVTVGWAKPTSGAHVDKFLILRNGTQVGSVPGERLSYTDKGLRPGVTYRYEVVAVAGSRRSAASDVAIGHTTTPPPVSVHKVAAGVTWLTVAWSPPDAPAPSAYYVMIDGTTAATLPGTTTSYRANGLTPATGYQVQVAAGWGSARSVPTSAYMVHTTTPPVSAARLSGSLSLQMRITDSGGGNVHVGKHWGESWTFTPLCGSGPCSVTLDGDFTPPGFDSHWFKITLRRNGAVYSGQTRAHLTHCGVAPLINDVQNTVIVRITVKAAQVSSSDWLATRFVGTMRIVSPYTQAGAYYCPAQSVSASLTSTG